MARRHKPIDWVVLVRPSRASPLLIIHFWNVPGPVRHSRRRWPPSRTSNKLVAVAALALGPCIGSPESPRGGEAFRGILPLSHPGNPQAPWKRWTATRPTYPGINRVSFKIRHSRQPYFTHEWDTLVFHDSRVMLVFSQRFRMRSQSIRN